MADTKQVCDMCGGSGWIGGPSYYDPGEGGEPCPDCNPMPEAQTPDSRFTDEQILSVLEGGVTPSYNDHGDLIAFARAIEAAEQLLRNNGYTITPPAKPLTFEDVTPMTEVPPEGTEYWVVAPDTEEGIYRAGIHGRVFDDRATKRRMAYLEKEHALIAARHHFGLKGGEL